MAKSARPPAEEARKAAKRVSMRPMLLAAGLGLYWFVEFQDAGAQGDSPAWGYMIVVGVQVFADFIGAWFIVSGLQLALSLGALGLGYLRGVWTRESA